MTFARYGKYNAKKVKLDGWTFDSKSEAKRYLELKLLFLAGKIADLQVHPCFPIQHNGVKVCVYEADFGYLDCEKMTTVFEDVKGMRTDTFRLKHKLMQAFYPHIDLRILEA